MTARTSERGRRFCKFMIDWSRDVYGAGGSGSSLRVVKHVLWWRASECEAACSSCHTARVC